MLLAAIPNITFPLNGILNTIFRDTWLQISILGFPRDGYRVTLIGLIILAILAFAVNGITERLAGKKAGGTLVAILITIFGSILVATFVLLPFDFAVEGVRIIASLLGAIVISVFYVLIKGSVSGKK
jgi:hypothetical protein